MKGSFGFQAELLTARLASFKNVAIDAETLPALEHVSGKSEAGLLELHVALANDSFSGMCDKVFHLGCRFNAASNKIHADDYLNKRAAYAQKLLDMEVSEFSSLAR